MESFSKDSFAIATEEDVHIASLRVHTPVWTGLDQSQNMKILCIVCPLDHF